MNQVSFPHGALNGLGQPRVGWTLHLVERHRERWRLFLSSSHLSGKDKTVAEEVIPRKVDAHVSDQMTKTKTAERMREKRGSDISCDGTGIKTELILG